MQSGTKKFRANNPELIEDVKPSGIDISRAPGQWHAVGN